ncbi:hypothetical protein RSK20926_15431 [Roseobacter sp. SK209-2-6]|nr:hypothetical protein RSK20926_15431 [Roseobacter sp. SK209-2-6]
MSAEAGVASLVLLMEQMKSGITVNNVTKPRAAMHNLACSAELIQITGSLISKEASQSHRMMFHAEGPI